MSVLSIVVASNSIKMASDGISFLPDGIIGRIGPKLVMLPHLDLVCGFTGPGLWADYVLSRETSSSPAHSFDDIIDMLPDHTRAAHERMVRDDVASYFSESPPEARNATMLVAGYSRRRERLEAYSLATYDKKTENRHGNIVATKAPFMLDPIEGFWLSWSLPEYTRKLFKVDAENFTPETPDIDVWLYPERAICAARSQSAGRLSAGGFVQGINLSFSSSFAGSPLVIETCIPHRWEDDMVGFPVAVDSDPMPAVFYPEALEFTGPKG